MMLWPQLSLEEPEGGLDGKDRAWLQCFFLLPITSCWSLLQSCCLWSVYPAVLGCRASAVCRGWKGQG